MTDPRNVVGFLDFTGRWNPNLAAVMVGAIGVHFGALRWLGARGAFIGMTGFGASAPGEALYPHFGITPEKVAEAARSLL